MISDVNLHESKQTYSWWTLLVWVVSFLGDISICSLHILLSRTAQISLELCRTSHYKSPASVLTESLADAELETHFLSFWSMVSQHRAEIGRLSTSILNIALQLSYKGVREASLTLRCNQRLVQQVRLLRRLPWRCSRHDGSCRQQA